ncbi:translation initiation factor eIF2B subunit alpha-like [Clavelina lepadiformis]|uniref:translation initiation factor eIF2B subunit alpha-like n=1 Tax=Clavelina lepadiformis TaxID=159417 RepID=UPI0040432060
MNDEEIAGYFEDKLKDDDLSSAIAAIETLLECLQRDAAETLSGLIHNLKQAKEVLVTTDCLATTSVSSGSDLFLRFITLASLELDDFKEVKEILISRGKLFLQKVSTCRTKITHLGMPFIKDGCVILTHSYSRVVACVLKCAAESKKRFSVYVTESCPDKSGNFMAQLLQEYDIPVTVILDAASGYILDKVDVVLIGAEGVVENGGIINKIGSYQLALCANALNKPVYVLAESFKFVRFFPLNQQDLPNQFKYKASTLKKGANLSIEHPSVDYTPPSLISLLITDLGVLTPSAVSDELIKLYL